MTEEIRLAFQAHDDLLKQARQLSIDLTVSRLNLDKMIDKEHKPIQGELQSTIENQKV